MKLTMLKQNALWITVLLTLMCTPLTACAKDPVKPEGKKQTETPKQKKLNVRLQSGLLGDQITDDMGLSYPDGLERIIIFEPSQENGDMLFNNHPQLVVFKNKLYATWVGHPKDEKSAVSMVYYSYSDDGVNWASPIQVGPESRASGGWITDGKTLGCLLITTGKVDGRTVNITEVMQSLDGKSWTQPKTLIENAGASESARRLPDGRYIMVCHGYGTGDFGAVRKTRIMYTDVPDGMSSWKEAELPDILPYNENEKEKVTRPVEASWYRRSDGILVMLFRDLWFGAKDRTWKLLVSYSYDNGTSWTQPVLTNIPDSDSMQCAGDLDGKSVFFVNNPVPTRRRVPLTVGVSRNGELFDRMFLLRSKPQPRRYDGGDKTEGYSYPGAVVWGDYLYVSYATNKEDVEISRMPVKSLTK